MNPLQAQAIAVSSEAIDAFCERWRIRELALFGSVLRDDFNQASDIDVMVSFEPSARITLLDWATMADELERLFGRPVDLVTRKSVETSENYLRREAVLSSAQVLYARG